jgi:hypothetical protein
MRVLTIAIIGLALATAGCSSPAKTSSAPAASAAPSGAATTSMASGDRIDQWASRVEQQRMKR